LPDALSVDRALETEMRDIENSPTDDNRTLCLKLEIAVRFVTFYIVTSFYCILTF